MANDRLFLRCSICGEKKLLAKWYPSGSICGDVSAFIDVHTNLCLQADGDLGLDCGIELLTEWGLIIRTGKLIGQK